MADGDWEGLDAAFDELEAELVQVVRGMSVELWNGVLAKTPQFHGRMAASWSYSIDTPHYVDRSDELDFVGPRRVQIGNFEPTTGLYRGHPEAIAVANMANAGRDAGFRLGQTIWLANGVDHGEGPYSQAVEDGTVRLRAVNRPGAPVERSADQLVSRYGEDVSAAQAQRLKLLKIGV